MNPLFQQFNSNNPADSVVSRFNQFRQNFKGNPQEIIQQMMNSGKITQAQYNAAVQQAQALSKMLGMK